jgi:DNA-binding GntR family transcriptional regulator
LIVYGSGTKEGCIDMSNSEACVAHAARCIEVAERACTAQDRHEFLTFAEAWERLATEIEQSEQLVAFLDELTTNTSAAESSDLPQRSYAKPLRQLAAAVAAISDQVASEAATRHLSLLLRR